MYVIVGASGFLGTYLMKNILQNTDESILAVARHVPQEAGNRRITWTVCDVADAGNVECLSAQASGRANTTICKSGGVLLK